jgi:hypothetical protein
MHEKSDGSWEAFTWRRLSVAEGVLVATLGLVAPIAGYLGWGHAGSRSLVAAGAAFLVCWLPNALSLLIMSFFRDPQQSVSAMLFGMLLRMGIPFGIAAVLLQTKHWLVDAGILPMVLGMYLVALVVETILSLWIVGALRPRVVKAS